MAGNLAAVKCKRKPTIASLINFNPAANHYTGGSITLASVTLAVVLCLTDHTVATQSATIERINRGLFCIINL
jgi:hypothetical protein